MLMYLFLCFSCCLVGLGAFIGIAKRMGNATARAFAAFYASLLVCLLAGVLLSFADTTSVSLSSQSRVILEYLEAMVGFYGLLLTIPFFAHRIFSIPEGKRDRWFVVIVGLACLVQHGTEYGFGGRWDELGDFVENVLFLTVVLYAFGLAVWRIEFPGINKTLANRFLLLVAVGIPVSVHDLFFAEATGLRFYPLLCCIWIAVATWAVYQSQPPRSVPSEWELTERECEVLWLVAEGLSNKEIAARLFISTNTVKTHVRALFDKSGCRSRFALMAALAPVSCTATKVS
ncbi:MAG: helix-turn-helix transcriptional regulator [Planctomycetota bacterium]